MKNEKVSAANETEKPARAVTAHFTAAQHSLMCAAAAYDDLTAEELMFQAVAAHVRATFESIDFESIGW